MRIIQEQIDKLPATNEVVVPITFAIHLQLERTITIWPGDSIFRDARIVRIPQGGKQVEPSIIPQKDAYTQQGIYLIHLPIHL